MKRNISTSFLVRECLAASLKTKKFLLVSRRWRLEILAIYFRSVQFNNSRKGESKEENAVLHRLKSQSASSAFHSAYAGFFIIISPRNCLEMSILNFHTHSLPFAFVRRRKKNETAKIFFLSLAFD